MTDCRQSGFRCRTLALMRSSGWALMKLSRSWHLSSRQKSIDASTAFLSCSRFYDQSRS